MRSLFNTELKTKRLLDAASIENFLPLEWKVREDKAGRKIKQLTPLVSNLIFVHASRDELLPLMDDNSKFQHIYRRGGSQHEPIVVPERQMSDFIRAVKSSDRPIYLSPSELPAFKPGQRISIMGGTLDGVEGRIAKIRGARSRRLVVEIPGLLAAAVEIDPALVRFM